LSTSMEHDADLDTPSEDGVVLTLDGVRYALSEVSENARQTLSSIQFCDEAIRQRQNELAISDTARLAYAAALKRELAKSSSGS
jgi:hypothetical protein